MPLSPVQRQRKFSDVLGTMSLNNSMMTRPTRSPAAHAHNVTLHNRHTHLEAHIASSVVAGGFGGTAHCLRETTRGKPEAVFARPWRSSAVGTENFPPRSPIAEPGAVGRGCWRGCRDGACLLSCMRQLEQQNINFRLEFEHALFCSWKERGRGPQGAKGPGVARA